MFHIRYNRTTSPKETASPNFSYGKILPQRLKQKPTATRKWPSKPVLKKRGKKAISNQQIKSMFFTTIVASL